MMYKRALRLAFVLVLCSAAWFALPTQAAQAEILVVTDFEIGTPSRADAVLEVLTYMSRGYLCVTPNANEPIEDYEAVIVVLRDGSSLGETLADALRQAEVPCLVIGAGGLDQLTDRVQSVTGVFEANYETGEGQQLRWISGKQTLYLLTQWDRVVGGTAGILDGEQRPLCAGLGHITSLAWLDEAAPTMRAALAELMAQWLWPYDARPWTYASYLVLQDVYPFERLDELMAITDMMVELGAPYAICVMPVYDNAHFPAMQRFCEYLRYAQSKGAAIVLRTPLVSINRTDADDIKERIELAFEAYTQYGVYPVALAAPQAYLFSEEGLSIIRGTRTVLLFETDDELSMPEKNLAFSDGHTIIAPAYSAGLRLYTDAYSSAIYLDVREELDVLRVQVQGYLNGRQAVRSLWSLPSSIYIGDHHLTYDTANGLFFDDQRDALEYEPFYYDEDFDFERGFVQYFTEQLETSNKLILTLVVGSVSILGLLIWMARKYMKRQFLVRQKKAGKSTENTEVM